MLRQGCSLSMLHRTCENCMGVLGWLSDMGVLGLFSSGGSYVGHFEHVQCLVHAFLFEGQGC